MSTCRKIDFFELYEPFWRNCRLFTPNLRRFPCTKNELMARFGWAPSFLFGKKNLFINLCEISGTFYVRFYQMVGTNDIYRLTHSELSVCSGAWGNVYVHANTNERNAALAYDFSIDCGTNDSDNDNENGKVLMKWQIISNLQIMDETWIN